MLFNAFMHSRALVALEESPVPSKLEDMEQRATISCLLFFLTVLTVIPDVFGDEGPMYNTCLTLTKRTIIKTNSSSCAAGGLVDLRLTRSLFGDDKMSLSFSSVCNCRQLDVSVTFYDPKKPPAFGFTVSVVDGKVKQPVFFASGVTIPPVLQTLKAKSSKVERIGDQIQAELIFSDHKVKVTTKPGVTVSHNLWEDKFELTIERKTKSITGITDTESASTPEEKLFDPQTAVFISDTTAATSPSPAASGMKKETIILIVVGVISVIVVIGLAAAFGLLYFA